MYFHHSSWAHWAADAADASDAAEAGFVMLVLWLPGGCHAGHTSSAASDGNTNGARKVA